MAVILKNNATSRLASSITAGATTLSVLSGEGARFPDISGGDWFPLTLIKATGAIEVLKCTARSGDVFTVTRAQEGTSGISFSAGDRVELRLTAAALAEMFSERQPLDAMLTALAALTTSSDQLLYFTGENAPAMSSLTAFMRTLLDDPDEATARATLGANNAANLTTGILPDDRISFAAGVTPTLVNSYVNGGNCKYWKFGKLVVGNIDVTRSSVPGTNTTMFTLPVGFRPDAALNPTGVYVVSLTFGLSGFTINTSGTVVNAYNAGAPAGAIAITGMFAFLVP